MHSTAPDGNGNVPIELCREMRNDFNYARNAHTSVPSAPTATTTHSSLRTIYPSCATESICLSQLTQYASCCILHMRVHTRVWRSSHAGLIESTLFLFWQFECRELEYSPQNISRILSSFEKRKLPPRDLVEHTVAVGWKMWFEHTQRDNLPYTYAAEAVKINSIRIHAIFHWSNFW